MESFPTTYLLKGVETKIPFCSRPLRESYRTSTLIYEADSGHSQRRQKSPPKLAYDVQYNVLPKACYETIRDFFIARKGQVEVFLWTNPITKQTLKVRFDQDMLQGEPVGNHPKFGELYKLSFKIVQEF